MNVLLCAIAAWVLVRNFHESKPNGPRRSIDWAGASALAVGAALVILGLLEGGQAWAWTSTTSIAIFTAGAVLFVLFVVIETRVPEPILPIWVLTRRVLITTSAVSCLVGAVVLGLTSYVPSFVQGSLGTTALVAGFTLAAMTLGWPVAASQSGRLYLRLGFRTTGLIGAVPLLTGTALLTQTGPDSTPWQVAGCCVVIGLGMGLIASPSLIAAQSSVEWSERGVVTGANAFARSIGSAVGVAVFGALANAALTRSGVVDGATPDAGQLASSVSPVFTAVLVCALVLSACVALIPNRPGQERRRS
ncbi:MFS transporter [Rhodococcus sp. SMB37]|nr:MFS transporter [Rhodococcus sp. SMB37]